MRRDITSYLNPYVYYTIVIAISTGNLRTLSILLSVTLALPWRAYARDPATKNSRMFQCCLVVFRVGFILNTRVQDFVDVFVLWLFWLVGLAFSQLSSRVMYQTRAMLKSSAVFGRSFGGVGRGSEHARSENGKP